MRQHILVVEHDKEMRDAICAFLERSGIEASVASDADEAFSQLLRFPAIVLIDLGLPERIGVEILQAVRELRMPIDVAVIASHFDAACMHPLTAFEPQVIFGKPFDFEEFSEWLQERFGGAGSARENLPSLDAEHAALRRMNRTISRELIDFDREPPEVIAEFIGNAPTRRFANAG